MHVIENCCHDYTVDSLPSTNSNALMIDDLAVIQTMKDLPKTFGSLAECIIKRVINTAKSFHASRVDFICDQYPEISIKNLERSKTAEIGSTLIRICNAEQKLPRQFKKNSFHWVKTKKLWWNSYIGLFVYLIAFSIIFSMEKIKIANLLK